jgi:hypothetical protein
MSEITRYEGIHGHMRSKKGRLVLFTDHEAALALKDGTIQADDERLIKAAEKAGITYMGCDTADWLAETVVELRGELGTKEAAIAFLRESLRMSNWHTEEHRSELAERNKTIADLMETKRFLESEIRRWSESRDGIMAENEAIEERNIKLTDELAACRSKLRYYEEELCTDKMIVLHDGNTAKAITWEKVSDILAERNECREVVRLFVSHHDGYNIDGSKRHLVDYKDDHECARNWQKVYEIAAAALKEANHGE